MNYKNTLTVALVCIGLSLLPTFAAMATLSQTLSGRILLQVEDNGEAWYVNPEDSRRYFLGRPEDAFQLMRELGLGISNADLEQIPESESFAKGNSALRNRLSGRILLQVEANGEAWYIHPVDQKRYFLGRPADAFAVMRQLGLGITTKDLQKISTAPNTHVPNGNGEHDKEVPIPDADDGLGQLRQELLEEINKERLANGLSALRLSNSLIEGAQGHADDMSKNQYFGFDSPAGATLEQYIQESGYEAQLLAANIANTNAAPALLVKNWRDNETDTYENILNEVFEDLGVGIGKVDDLPVYTVVFGLSIESYFNEQTADLADLTIVRTQMLGMVNEERQRVGLPPLVANDRLHSAIQGHTDDMLGRSYYGHKSPEGDDVAVRSIEAGYNYGAIGENIAKGQFSVEEVMQGWMNSKNHRENILSPEFEEIGIGLSFGKNNNGFEVIWGQNFGTER